MSVRPKRTAKKFEQYRALQSRNNMSNNNMPESKEAEPGNVHSQQLLDIFAKLDNETVPKRIPPPPSNIRKVACTEGRSTGLGRWVCRDN